MTSRSTIYPLRYSLVWLAGGYLVLAGIIFASLLPGMPGPEFAESDKVLHFGVYLMLMLWFAGIYLPHRQLRTLLLLAALGVGLEFVQELSGLRQGDWRDIVANLSGLFAGLLLARMGLTGWCLMVERRLFREPRG